MFQTKVVEKIKTNILCSVTFFRKSRCLWDNVEKYGRAGQVTDDNIIRPMRFACFITETTDTHSEYVVLVAFPRQQWLSEHVSFLLDASFTSRVRFDISLGMQVSISWKGIIITEEWIGKYLEGSDRGRLDVLFQYFPSSALRKPTNAKNVSTKRGNALRTTMWVCYIFFAPSPRRHVVVNFSNRWQFWVCVGFKQSGYGM